MNGVAACVLGADPGALGSDAGALGCSGGVGFGSPDGMASLHSHAVPEPLHLFFGLRHEQIHFERLAELLVCCPKIDAGWRCSLDQYPKRYRRLRHRAR